MNANVKSAAFGQGLLHKDNKAKRTALRALVLTLLVGALGVSAFAATAENAALSPYLKEETVYGSLDASGGVRTLYIVNTLLSDQSGTAVDYGGYKAVTNLSDSTALDYNSGEGTVKATLTAGEPFMYQGALDSTTLPWLFTIRYTIDGKEVAADELGGMSGRLGIMVGAVRNAGAADASYYDNFALQVSLLLSRAVCRNVTVTGATLADAGLSRQVTATALPGSPLYFSVGADVTDFEMGSITIAAAPFSMKINLPGIQPMLEQFSQLTDGSAQIQQGIAGMRDALDAALNGAEAEDDESPPTVPSASQISLGMSMMVAALNGTSRQLGQMETGLTALAASISQLAASLPAAPLDEEQTAALAALYESAPESKALLDQLAAGYAAAAAGGAALTEAQPQAVAFAQAVAPLRSGLDTVASSLSQSGETLTSMSAQADGLKQLLDGLTQLNDQYSLFHEGIASIPDQAEAAIHDMTSAFDRSGYQPNSYADERCGQVEALQFTLRTDAIAAPKAAAAEEPAQKPETFLERLTKLFK
ncbi:MAG: hypothetical protein LBB86_10680 [Oscillospiraceae bacterium]|jgi:uncharacterized phage infection (PIP) family protein YhgE|nr:hypothetical protein [Oscillospiraceae bacterium]